MLALAYDTITRTDDYSRVAVRPNCQVWDEPGSPYERRYGCGMLLPLCILQRHRLSCEATEALLEQGKPFVYPLELRFNLRESLLRNPELAPGLPRAVVERVAAGQAAILVWIGHEPVPFHLDPEGRTWVFDIVQNFIRQHDLPPQRVWFVSGNVLADQSFLHWRRARGLPEQHTFHFLTIVMSPTSVRVQYQANERGENLTLSEDNDVWTFTLTPLSAAEFAERYVQPAEIAEERRTGRLRPKRFLAMNRQPRLHRQILVSYLHDRALLDSSLVSLDTADSTEIENVGDLGAFPGLGPRLVNSWRALQPMLPLVIDRGAGASGIDFHRVSFGWPYRESYVNIVTETEVAPGVAPICTEKLIKPILNLQPFIAISTAQTLRCLRNLGFQTFGRILREDYDEVEDPVERLLQIFEQIDGLGTMSQAEVRDLYFDCLPELENNRAHLLEGRHQFDLLLDALEAELG